MGLSMHRLHVLGLCLLAALAVASVSAGQTAGTTRAAARAIAPSASVPRLLPGTQASVLTTIQGNALNSTNGALPDSRVRLRDARFGGILDAQITDKAGMFRFASIDPGMYIVELVDNEHTVMAASQLLSIGAGEILSAVVKLPFKIPPFGGLLGHTIQQAAAVTSAAAASGVMAKSVTGQDASAR